MVLKTTPSSVYLVQLRQWSIDADGGARFWCGFCNKIIDSSRSSSGSDASRSSDGGNGGGNARIDHVGAHFNGKDKKTTKDWICVKENVPKGELYEAEDQSKGQGLDGL